MAKNSMKPQIRFKGFTDAWEQRKLGDILQTLPFKQFLKEPEMDGKYEVIQQGGEPIIGFANGTPCTDYKDIVIFGDHTLSLYKPKQPFFVATDGVRILKGTKNVDGFFLLFLLERYKPQSEGYKRYFNILSDIECFMSYNISEQKKIGAFFDTLDNLITLHQRKYEKFVNMKKALLEKMFPQGDEKVPRIRFKGFTDAWEQRKFESLAKTRRGLTYNPSHISSHGIRVLRSSNINEDTFVLSDEDVFVCQNAVKIECVKPNDILITAANGSTRLVGKHAIIVGIRENEAVHGGFMLVASSSKPFFLNAAMSAPWYLKFINLFVAGGNGAIGNLNKNDLDNQVLLVPENNEQDKIGAFFRNLDNLITLHQRQVEKLKNIKSALLEKMFV